MLPGWEYRQEAGRELVIPCAAAGDPFPVITWRKVPLGSGAPGERGRGTAWERAVPTGRGPSSDGDSWRGGGGAGREGCGLGPGAAPVLPGPLSVGGFSSSLPLLPPSSLPPCLAKVGKPSRSKHSALPGGSLQFRALSKEDHGQWECSATNVVTSITASTHLTVVGMGRGKAGRALGAGLSAPRSGLGLAQVSPDLGLRARVPRFLCLHAFPAPLGTDSHSRDNSQCFLSIYHQL